MKKILFVKKKIGSSYLIWFQNSNSYFSLEEPAWYVFMKIVKEYKSENIAEEFSKRYELDYNDSLSFVSEIRQKINEMNKTSSYGNSLEKPKKELVVHNYRPCSKHCYNMQNKVIEFSFENSWLETYVHPLLQYFETSEEFSEKSHFELFTYEDRVIFRLDNVIKGSWGYDESEYVKGRILVELVNVLYDKTEEDWLMTLHASAITNDKKSILFPAAPGSGKTTFAALLQANGYRIISDDFVPIERSTFKAYSLPLAMSVKKGSLELLTSYYPELEKNEFFQVNPEKIVKYLPLDIESVDMAFPVNEIVFVKYDKSVDFEIEKVDTVQALNTIIDEAWIPSTPENVVKLMDKLSNISFYKLTYSNNQKAIAAITKLFEDDQ